MALFGGKFFGGGGGFGAIFNPVGSITSNIVESITGSSDAGNAAGVLANPGGAIASAAGTAALGALGVESPEAPEPPAPPDFSPLAAALESQSAALRGSGPGKKPIRLSFRPGGAARRSTLLSGPRGVESAGNVRVPTLLTGNDRGPLVIGK